MGQSVQKLYTKFKRFIILRKKSTLLFECYQSQYTFKDFEKIKKIAYGSQGQVYKVKHTNTGKFHAMKIIDKRDAMVYFYILKRLQQLKSIEIELFILQQMNSPFILKLNYYVEDSEKIGFVTDLMHKDLKMILEKEKTFSLQKTQFFAAEITLALQYLHQEKYIYRDLKPENVLLDFDGHIKLTDFGICRKISIDEQTFSGTREYTAPEVLQAKKFNVMVDWWSLGILIFEMLTGMNPFQKEKFKQKSIFLIKGQQYQQEHIFQNLMQQQFNDELYNLTQNSQDIIHQLLQLDPKKRLGFENGSQDIKNHPFFENINWIQLQRQICITNQQDIFIQHTQNNSLQENYPGFSLGSNIEN